MCREQRSIDLLIKYEEEEGRLVINSGTGIENCTRERMTRFLIGHGIPYPESIVVDTDEVVRPRLEKAGFTGAWIKRGDGCAMHKEDVKRAVINRHLVGDLIKFYGISGSDYFFWFYPFDEGHSKYGLEAINGKSRGIPFEIDRLKEICQRAADVLDVKIYGGDCVVSDDGEIRIIDFNDWPSFAPCRAEAAPHIAKCILQAIKNRK